tara:strand:- start:25896 stop:26099 length:204 start_codon:yes stop_codon:yes gene_type:complete
MLIKSIFICCAIGGFLSVAGTGEYIKDFSTMSSNRHAQIGQQVNGAVAGSNNHTMSIARQINLPGAQ